MSLASLDLVPAIGRRQSGLTGQYQLAVHLFEAGEMAELGNPSAGRLAQFCLSAHRV